MVRSSGYETNFDAGMVLAAAPQERHAMLNSIIRGMFNGNRRAGNTAYWLGNHESDASDASAYNPVSYSTETAHGNMTPKTSLRFLQGTDRLSGFVGAIKRWDNPEAAIDVGCGPFPVLALAAAVYHPAAEIVAVEINPKAAERAAELVNVFGLADRLHVVNTDITDYKIDANTSAAVTETFNAGLAFEPGPKIVRLLHDAGVPTITPSRARLHLQVDDHDFFSWVDLRNDTHASIEFDNPESETHSNISAAYHDDLGLVLDYGADVISGPLSVGGRLSRSDADPRTPRCRLTYELGGTDFLPHFETVENFC